MTLAATFNRLRRHPRVLIATVAASALLAGAASAGYGAVVDAETRASRNADIDRVTASIAATFETGRGIVGAHFAAAVCVAETSAQLAPVADSGARFTTASLDRASTVVQRAAVAALVPAYDPEVPTRVPADAGVDALDAALVVLRRAQTDAETEVAALASKARRTEQECAYARSAVASFVDEVTRHTDELIAANPKAAADTVAGLTAARDAVVAAETGAVERWIAAAAALEASHAAAVLAEQQAAEAARQAAEREESSDPRVTSGMRPLNWDDYTWPWSPEEPYRQLSPEEVAALGMPPGSQIWEVPLDEDMLPPLILD
ncbi:hypothetical protein J7E29_12465 [Streptomyces sp. ISL-90]|nr:hypothetical protein [Streptomyces sp. ISL-90]